MSLTFTDSHLALSKKLGWDAMPAIVAIPAIDKIVETACAQVAHAVGCTASFDEMATIMLKNWSSDDMFAMLADDEDFSLSGELRHLFISLRWEIEECMSLGYHYQDAINERFK